MYFSAVFIEWLNTPLSIGDATSSAARGCSVCTRPAKWTDPVLGYIMSYIMRMNKVTVRVLRRNVSTFVLAISVPSHDDVRNQNKLIAQCVIGKTGYNRALVSGNARLDECSRQ